jgi:hypothetical protein
VATTETHYLERQPRGDLMPGNARILLVELIGYDART